MPRQFTLLVVSAKIIGMDAIDRKIVAALQRDARITNQALADEVGLSPSPCLRRVRTLEQSGVIEGYAAQVNRRACGLPITVFVRVRLKEHSHEVVDAFERRIVLLDDVLECHITSGAEDYLLQVVVDSQEGYERFMRDKLRAIPGIAALESSFAFGQIKKTAVLPAPAV